MRDAQRKTTFGLDRTAFDALVHAQGGVCRLCRSAFDLMPRRTRTSVCVDHDHATGRVRGLLCIRCNTALGVLGDHEAGLVRALAYVRGTLDD